MAFALPLPFAEPLLLAAEEAVGAELAGVAAVDLFAVAFAGGLVTALAAVLAEVLDGAAAGAAADAREERVRLAGAASGEPEASEGVAAPVSRLKPAR